MGDGPPRSRRKLRSSDEAGDDLILVHRASGGTKAGRRARETSVNRAIVVLTVASWQAVIQDLTLACIDLSVPGLNDGVSWATYNSLMGRVRKDVIDLNTPNARNTRRLMVSAGFDPRPFWTWRQHGGRGMRPVSWGPHEAEVRMDEWLSLRHAIAHGAAVLPRVQVLRAVRGSPGSPRASRSASSRGRGRRGGPPVPVPPVSFGLGRVTARA